MRTKKIVIIILVLAVFLAGLWVWGMRNPEGASLLELGTAAGQSYVYGYPLVLMDVTREAMLEAQNRGEHDKEAVNRFIHVRSLPDADFKAVVRPNLDTLYSNAWLDLTEGPLVMEVPDMGDRYYLLQVMDAWTNVIAAPGTRTTGSEAARFLITGPDQAGEVPAGMTVINSPTNMAWILGRIQIDGVDYDVIHALQDEIKLIPLDDYQAGTVPLLSGEEAVNPDVRPSHRVAEMSSGEFFKRMAFLMKENPPAPEDGIILEQLRTAGIKPGEQPEQKDFGFIARLVIDYGVRTARGLLDEAISVGGEATREGWGTSVEDTYSAMGSLGQVKTREGWSTALEDIGSYGSNYGFRAGVALIGLGANLPEDAVYPTAAVDSEGVAFDGAGRYTLHFEADRLPPVKAFWSVTLYNEEGFLVDNPINRFALTDRDPLVFNNDGSLTLYIQADNPGGERENNWLPAPASGPFTLTARLYRPYEEVLKGEWNMPGVKRID